VLYFFHPAAKFERFEAAAYYKQQRQELGDSYFEEFQKIMERILAFPERYKIALEPDIRRLAFDRFPYHVIYRVIDNQIQVLAVAHQSRRPNYWYTRLEIA
jgi:toxin ParE1/3/4